MENDLVGQAARLLQGEVPRPLGVLPERMAPVNALLDVAPPRLRAALLTAFLAQLMRSS
ncbi:MAG TPA: hypothetical protein VFT31_08060 [Kribbella sp.]|nr:hypothetical protein [Kribbella sp.]